MEKELELIVKESSELSIVDQETFELAGEYLKKIKTAEKEIEDYWTKPIANAHNAHKELIAKKKEILDPFNEAEKKVKKNMSAYITEQEKAKALLEATTNEYGVDVALPDNIDKVDGISYSDSYEIQEIDITKLPKELNGVILVKPDESAIKNLIKLAKGNIEIPGVKFKEEKTIRAKGGK